MSDSKIPPAQVQDTFDIEIKQLNHLNTNNYKALKALYEDTNGDNWNNNTGWSKWDFSNYTPPDASIVNNWYGVTVVDDRITKLDLGNNELTGEIPNELGNLSNLQYLYLYRNELTGEIPNELGNLSNLQYLSLSNNELTGEIPNELGNLSSLERLYLSNNELTGEIPNELGNLSSLKRLWLYNNELTGEIPQSVNNLSGNKRLNNPPYSTSEIPNQTTTTNTIFNLDVSDNFSDINQDINRYSAEGLPNGLSINQNSGIIVGTPTTPGNHTVTITVSDSQRPPAQVQDTFDIEIKQLNHLNTDDYKALKALYQSTDGDNWKNNTGWSEWDFSNSTPPDASVVDNWYGVTVVGDKIKNLSLYNNQLTGEIPKELGNLSNLQTLYLNRNYQLTGEIPKELGNLSNLQELNLDDNQLTGEIPKQLGNLSNLQRLFLARNQFTGNIPEQLGNLSNLQHLFLNNNKLTGAIPEQLSNLFRLKTLHLENNKLTGKIPEQLSNLSNLSSLSLHHNQLTGEIPEQLGNLSNLSSIYLSYNELTGEIPEQLGNLSNLSSLSLSNNELTREIPGQLGNLSNLGSLSLSKYPLSKLG